VSQTPWASPFLRWAGSKRALLPELMTRAPQGFDRYVEPFAGSACLFFALRPRRAIIGDLNADLIQAYREVCVHPRRVARHVHEWGGDPTTYYRVRGFNPAELPDIERAARFVYLNRHCFNGVYRTNRQNHFNVPIGRRAGRVPPASHFYRCSVALRDAHLCSEDFSNLIDDARPGDFFYLDPPYSRAKGGAYGVYGYGSFDDRALDRLIVGLEAIQRAGAHFLLSYTDDERLQGLDERWRVSVVSVRAQVAGRAEERRERREVLVDNYSSAP